MEKDSNKKSLVYAVVVTILLLLLATAAYLLFRSTNKTDESGSKSIFSFKPFDRTPVQQPDPREPEPYVPIDERGEVTPATPTQVPRAPRQEVTVRYYPEPQRYFLTYENPPEQYQTPAPVVRVANVTQPPPIYITEQNLNFSPPAWDYSQPTYQGFNPGTFYSTPSATGTAQTVRRTSSENGNDASVIAEINEIDKQIFGFVTGLGWTQLLGSTGQQAFDFLYGLTPQGSTYNALNSIFNFGGSGGGGGGSGAIAGGAIAGGVIGGGMLAGGLGGGGVMNFGGMVSRVTYCTCSTSLMLDINDVRGQPISLVYTPGVSILYADYNIYGIAQNVLGDYVPGGQCMVYHGEDCTPEGAPRGTIKQIGTSM